MLSSAAAAGAESGAPSEPPSDIDEIKKLREQLKGCRYEDFTVSSYAIGTNICAWKFLCINLVLKEEERSLGCIYVITTKSENVLL